MSIAGVNNQPLPPVVGSNPLPGASAASNLSPTNVKVSNQKDKIPTTSFWESHIEPHYKRLFKPMNRTDAVIIGTGVALAAVVMTLALTVFNIAFFNIALMTSGVIVIGAYSISAIRVKKHHEAKAWAVVEDIRKNVMRANMPQHNLDYIQRKFNKLRDSKEFTLQEKDVNHIEKLDSEIKSYRHAMKTSREVQEYYDGARTTFIAYLEGLQKTLSPNKSKIRDEKIKAKKAAAEAEVKKKTEADKKKKAEPESKTEATIIIEEVKED